MAVLKSGKGNDLLGGDDMGHGERQAASKSSKNGLRTSCMRDDYVRWPRGMCDSKNGLGSGKMPGGGSRP